VLEKCSAVQIFEPGFIDPVIEQIEAEARAAAARLDISTEANRQALKSLAWKVARSKTFIDNQRKALVTDEKRRLKRIDEEGSRIWDRLENLQTEVRRPLTEWEEADRARIASHERELGEIENAGPQSLQNWQMLSAEAMRDRLREIETDPHNWEEFGVRAAGVKAVAKTQILEAIGKREKYDAEQAELVRLRAEAADRERKEREERIAREATEKAEREAKAREEKAARDAEFQRLKIEDDRRAAEQRAKDAETRRILAEEKAQHDAKAAAERAERDKQAAVKAERERAAAKAQREKEEQERRESSARIRAKVLKEARLALQNHCQIEPEQSDVILDAIIKGLIPHVMVVF
jgi:hypothetical protein